MSKQFDNFRLHFDQQNTQNVRKEYREDEK